MVSWVISPLILKDLYEEKGEAVKILGLRRVSVVSNSTACLNSLLHCPLSLTFARGKKEKLTV